jgi:hypothetical protein
MFLAANTYSCNAYGSGNYNACTESRSGSLAGTGTKLLLAATIFAIVLFLSIAIITLMRKHRMKSELNK